MLAGRPKIQRRESLEIEFNDIAGDSISYVCNKISVDSGHKSSDVLPWLVIISQYVGKVTCPEDMET